MTPSGRVKRIAQTLHALLKLFGVASENGKNRTLRLFTAMERSSTWIPSWRGLILADKIFGGSG